MTPDLLMLHGRSAQYKDDVPDLGWFRVYGLGFGSLGLT